MALRHYIALIVLAIGATVGWFFPGGIDPQFALDANNILLILLLFLLSSQFDITAWTKSYTQGLKFISLFIISSAIILTAFSNLIMGIPIFESIILSVLLCSTASWRDEDGPESHLSTPIVFILAYILIAVHRTRVVEAFGWSIQSIQFLQEVIVPIFIGLLIGLFMSGFMRKHFHKMKLLLSIAAAFVAWLLSTMLGGNGFLAVIVAAVSFGPFFVHHKNITSEFLREILLMTATVTFFLLGYASNLPWHPDFMIRSLMLFAILMLIRFSVSATIYKMRPKQALLNTFKTPLSSALIPIAIIFIASLRFAFMASGYVIFALVIYSSIASLIACFYKS
ncbi:MAG: hypothetical protein ACE5DM_05070 [Candidatus Nanoarchaeia archaeon]